MKYSAYIKKYNPELIEVLKDLGYEPSGFNKDDEPYLFTSGHMFYTTRIEEDKPFSYLYGHNCEENEELFIAIASIREDNDLAQWFVSDINGEFFLCGYRTMDEMKETYAGHMNSFLLKEVHKASPAELRKFFTDKDRKSVEFEPKTRLANNISREEFLKECDDAACRYISYHCIEMSTEDAFGYIYDMIYNRS